MKHSGLERCVLSRSIKKVTHQSNYFLHFLAIKVYENNSIVCYVFLVEDTFIYYKYIFYYYFRHHEHFESKRVRRSIWILTFIIFDHLHFCHNYRTCDHLYEREKKRHTYLLTSIFLVLLLLAPCFSFIYFHRSPVSCSCSK